MNSITIGTLFHYANEADPGWRDRHDDAERGRIFARMAEPRATADAGTGDTGDQGAKVHSDAPPPQTPPQSLQWLDMSNWDNEPVPVRKWAIADRVPLNQVGLFSGEGGTGKSSSS